MTATRCACTLTGLTVTVPDPDCQVQAHSPQWQAFERRQREPLEFVRALITGGLARLGDDR